jgi:hypothetical protein
MKAHAMFLRTACKLPDGLKLNEKHFSESWMSVDDTAAALDVKVRSMGWQFLWLRETYARFGIGRTEASAIAKATHLGLNHVKHKFNAAELGEVKITRCPWFRVAKVTVITRQIQQEVLLSLIDEITIKQLSAR